MDIAHSETLERNGRKALIKVYYDPEPLNPRTEYDNVGKMIYTSGRYTLGDERVDDCRMALFLAALEARGRCGRYSEDEIIDRMGNAKVWAFINRYLIVLPVYAYIHSGIVLSTGGGYPFNDRWDGGQCGYIYCTRAKALAEWSIDTEARAIKYLDGEVKTLDAVHQGRVYGFDVVGLDEDSDTEGQDLESVWGYIDADNGDDYGGALSEAKSVANHWLDRVTTPEHFQAADI